MKTNFSIRNQILCAVIMTIAALILWEGCAKKVEIVPPLPLRKIDGLPLSGQFRSLEIGDVDNDGHLDIIGGSSSPGTVVIWYGDGQGGASEPVFLPIKGDARSVALGDFNEDGFQDIVFSVQKESSGIMVWHNQPGRKWVRGISPIEGNSYEGIKTGDVNGDGHIDILAANGTSQREGGIQIWLGDGKGNWPIESGPTNMGLYMDVALADLDHNGTLDLVGSGWGADGGLRVWLGDGHGTWSPTLVLDYGSFHGITVTDINHDTHSDILAGTYRQGIRIFRGDGTGSFEKLPSPAETGSFWKVLTADIDNDGTTDIFSGSVELRGIRVWKHDEATGWLPIDVGFPSFGTYYEMANVDLNRDGHNDICAASFGEGIRLWMGKGGAVTSPRPIRFVSNAQTESETSKIVENEVFTTLSGFPEYKIGPGDILEITLWKGSEAEKQEIQVRPDGKISFAFVENLFVSGMTPIQLDDMLTRDLQEYIKFPKIDVVIKKFQSKFVTLVGEIYTNVNFRSGPGKYELTGKTSILEMISRVGGPTQNANLRDVRIRRKNGQSISVDVYKVINQGDMTQDIILDDGDLVFVPGITKEANRVYVFGEVEKPGVYTFSGSEMRLFDAVAEAGGVTVFSIPDETRIIRGERNRPEIVSADLRKLIEEGDQTQNHDLLNGDLVYIPRSRIGDLNVFLKKISPILNLIAIPARILRDVDSTSDVLRLQ